MRGKLYQQVGAQIARIRKKRGLSQDALAQAIGLSRTSVVNIETGRHRVQLHVLYEIAQEFGVDPRDLLPAPPYVELDAALSSSFKKKLHALKPEEQEGVRRVLQKREEVTRVKEPESGG